MRVAVGFDHAGVPLRDTVFEAIEAAGDEAIDLGTDSDDSVDYPDIALRVTEAIKNGDADRGVLCCGSGAGVAVAANKVRGIYAAPISDTYTAHQAVEHDDLNVLCLGGRVVGEELAGEIIKAFLPAQFTGEERHERRVGKIKAIEEEQ